MDHELHYMLFMIHVMYKLQVHFYHVCRVITYSHIHIHVTYNLLNEPVHFYLVCSTIMIQNWY